MPIIDVKATGTNIKNIIKSKGLKMRTASGHLIFNAVYFNVYFSLL